MFKKWSILLFLMNGFLKLINKNKKLRKTSFSRLLVLISTGVAILKTLKLSVGNIISNSRFLTQVVKRISTASRTKKLNSTRYKTKAPVLKYAGIVGVLFLIATFLMTSKEK